MKLEFTEGFKEDMRELFSEDWHYWIKRKWNAFKRIPREIRWKRQRMKRGWSDEDVWGAYHHIAEVCAGMLEHLSENRMGYPAYTTNEEWTAKLKSIAKKIRAYNDMSEMPDGWTREKEEEAYKITQEGLREMVDVFGHLWD